MCALAAHVFIRQSFAAQVPVGQTFQTVRLVHFQHITLQHGVVCIALHFNAMVGKHMAVVFHMLTQFVFAVIFQPRLELLQHVLQRQLRWGICGVMRQWNVGSLSCGHTHADAHQLRLHFHQRCGLGVQRHQRCVLQHIQPALKAVPGEHGFVIHRHLENRCGCIEQHTNLTHTTTGVCRCGGARLRRV